MGKEKTQPATTWTLRGFPLDLRAEVEHLKWERKLKYGDRLATNATVVADAIRFYLEHGGHTPEGDEKSPEK